MNSKNKNDSKSSRKTNTVEIDLTALKDAISNEGTEATRHSCLSQGFFGEGLGTSFPITVTSFDELLPLKDLKKGDEFSVVGELHHYKPKNRNMNFYSILVKEMKINKKEK